MEKKKRYSFKSPSRGGKRAGAGRKPGSHLDEQTKKMRNAFSAQKCNAKIRGIEWQFTFEEWLAWWGDDFNNRGRKKGQLVMARYNDAGPYHPDNCKKITSGENSREIHANKNFKYQRSNRST